MVAVAVIVAAVGLASPWIFSALRGPVPSRDIKAPTPLALGKVVAGRLGDSRTRDGSRTTEEAHYWLVELPAGQYKIVLDARTADGSWSMIEGIDGRLEWITLDQSERTPCGDLKDKGPRARKVMRFTSEVSTKRILRYENRLEVSDYELGIFPADASINVPFFVKCPEILELKLGQPATTPSIGNKQQSRDTFCAIDLTEGDYVLDVEFRDIDGVAFARSVGGSIDVLDSDGGILKTWFEGSESNTATMRRRISVNLAGDRRRILRIRAALVFGETREVAIIRFGKP
jgi:hypothetical protein